MSFNLPTSELFGFRWVPVVALSHRLCFSFQTDKNLLHRSGVYLSEVHIMFEFVPCELALSSIDEINN